MKSRALLLGLLPALTGCAVTPFIPEIMHVPRMIASSLSPASAQSNAAANATSTPAPYDSTVAAEIAAKPTKIDEDSNPPAAAPAAPSAMGLVLPVSVPTASAAQASGADGTIAISRGGFMELAGDVKAYRVGDVVTVDVNESVNGQSTAETNLSGTRSLNAGIPNLLTGAESLGVHNPLLNLANLINSSSNNASDGKGAMTAANTLTATVSALVIEILPSGNLLIHGVRNLKINGEDDGIDLSGVVRPEDIDETNSIASSEVADLKVNFAGSGLVHDKQGPGLGARLFDWLWLF